MEAYLSRRLFLQFLEAAQGKKEDTGHVPPEPGLTSEAGCPRGRLGDGGDLGRFSGDFDLGAWDSVSHPANGRTMTQPLGLGGCVSRE